MSLESEGQQEYEVDFISQARVSQKRGRGATKFWEFRVRWKGFKEADDTWEPIESFKGSEDLVTSFWERTREKRDYHDLSQFQVKDTFVPKGPPPRKKKHKASLSSSEPSSPAKPAKASTFQPEPQRSPSPLNDVRQIEIDTISTSKRRRGLIDYMKETQPSKRTRRSAPLPPSKDVPSASATSSRRKLRWTPEERPGRAPSRSPELVPDSDEDSRQPLVPEKRRKPSKATLKQLSDVEDNDSLFNEDVNSNTMSKGRIRMHDEPSITISTGQISAKRRVFEQKTGGQSSANTRTAASRSAPTRLSSRRTKATSSLLTADKQGLKTIKGRRAQDRAMNVDAMDVTSPEPIPPPNPEELLALAGLDSQDAEELEDFTEGPPPKTKETDAKARHAANIREAGENLFPSVSSAIVGEGQAWRAPTIFGLSSTLPARDTLHQAPSLENATPFWLNLDASVSLPTLLAEAIPAGTKLSPEVRGAYKSAPGKFYSPKAAAGVLNSIRSNTGFGKVVILAEDLTEGDRRHFSLFTKRLEDGDLFVASAGVQTYAMCASINATLCQRLNIPPALQGLPGQVLITKIFVENYSGYAEAAAQADDLVWSQYVESLF